MSIMALFTPRYGNNVGVHQRIDGFLKNCVKDKYLIISL